MLKIIIMMGNNNHKTSSASATHMGKEKKGKLWEIEANDAFLAEL